MGALLGSAALMPTSAGAQEGVTTFVSNPKVKPPSLIVNRATRGQAPGYVFAALFKSPFSQATMTGQPGAMILDNRGRFVWYKPVKQANEAANLQVQRYRGKPVLTFWDGELVSGHDMKGTWYVLDNRYRTIARVTPKDGFFPSVHEFFVTKQNTALTTYYREIPNRDLSSVGGPQSHTLIDSGVAEYDIRTGRLLKTWSPDGRIPMSDAFVPVLPNQPYDPWHINSIDVDSDGNWLLSMRNTHAIYKVNPTTGAILWTLGGKSSTFALGDRAKFAFQHDARFRPGSEISMFDNNCCGNPMAAPQPVSEKQSRGLILKLDENAKTATFVKEQTLYDLIAGTQANQQLLPNGNTFIGWGQQPFLSEHTRAGKLLLSVRYTDPASSYRAYRYQWTGRPTGRPAVAARVSGSRTRVYVSWNGATEVASYRVFGGPTSRRLRVVAKRVGRQGFETSALVRSAGPIFRVQALDRRGRVLGTSRAVRRQNTSGNAPAPTY